MKYLFIHYKFIHDVVDSISNYIKHTEEPNEDNIDSKKHIHFIKERNRKIKKNQKEILSKYCYFDICYYKLSNPGIKSFLVWLKLIDINLYNNIMYNHPNSITDLIVDKNKYWKKILDFKYSYIKTAMGYSNTMYQLKKMKEFDILLDPIRLNFK